MSDHELRNPTKKSGLIISLETRDHILLSCGYSLDVWSEVINKCNPPSSMFADWSGLLSIFLLKINGCISYYMFVNSSNVDRY